MLTKNEIIGICSAVAGIIIIIIIGTSMKGDSSRITSVILNQPSSYIPSFVELGSFEGKDENGKKIKKTYFLSNHLKSTWTLATAICHSYGLQFVSFETKLEADEFLNICQKQYTRFETHTHIGGISYTGNSKTDFYWMNSGKKIDYELKFGAGEPNNYDGKEFCLSLVRMNGGEYFHYNDYDCSDTTGRFVCQKLL